MTTQTKQDKAKASADKILAKFIEAKAAYEIAYKNLIVRTDYNSCDYAAVALLKDEMNKWSGQYSKQLHKVYS